MDKRSWNGRAVLVNQADLVKLDKSVTIRITPDAAGNLANALRMIDNQCRRLSHRMNVNLRELMTALDYVLVADPASVAEHRRMEASKGMDPAESTPPRDDTDFIPFT